MEHLTITSDFSYPSHFVDVKGAKMHYIDEGQGDPLIFIHGIPTWSYLWRNVIPYLSKHHRCIALDLMGLGKSDKPDIAYTVFEHIEYVEAFLQALNLKNYTLVLHGWGSVIGFAVAHRNEDQLKRLIFLEAHIRPITDWSMISLPVAEMLTVLGKSDGGYDMIVNGNYYVKEILPSLMMRQLTPVEMNYYQAPFEKAGSAKPIWQFLQELPLGQNDDPKVLELISDYSQWLCKTSVPKLLLYGVPGIVMTMDTIQWAKEHLSQLTVVDIGEALHCPQESNPENVGNAIAEWLHLDETLQI